MKSLKFYSIVLITILLCSYSKAQITIDGTVTDSELNPISDALIEIIDETDTSNVYSDVTDASGNFSISNITEIESEGKLIPTDHIVLRNYPNPFNPTTIIYFELPRAENIEIKIYDILGREVRTLFSNHKKAGVYHMTWDGRGDFGRGIAAGVYFCRIKTKDQIKVHKMVLLDGGTKSTISMGEKAVETKSSTQAKVNELFDFTVRVSGNSILQTDFKYLKCSSDTTLNLIVPQILQTIIIGPEGGKLEIEEFSLNIPAGAFSEETEIKIGIDQNQLDFNEYRLTNTFLLEGFPQFFNETFSIQIKYEGNITDSAYIVFGKKEYDSSINKDVMFYNLFSAKDSSGYLISNFISPGTNTSIGLDRNISNKYPGDGRWSLLKILGIGGHKSLNHESLHFNYIYPNNMPFEKVEFLGNSVENAFTKFLEIGFSYGYPVMDQSTKKKIPITKTNINTLGYFHAYKPRNAPIGAVVVDGIINKDVLVDLDEKTIRRQAASLFFTLIPYWYDFDQYNTPGRRWIHQASKIWAGTLFPQDNGYIPPEMFGNEMQPFKGIEINQNLVNSELTTRHGNGMSSLIKYLCNYSMHGNKIIANIYNELKTKDFPYEAVNSAMEKPSNVWWPNFFKEYLQGNIYNIPSNVFLNNISKKIVFNNGDTQKNINETYNDLSAKLFQIDINSDEIKNRTLNFSLGPENLNLEFAKVLVFGTSNDQLVFLGDGVDLNIRGFQYYQSLLVCVVNSSNKPPYTGSTSIDLDIKVTDDLAFEYCDIRLSLIIIEDTLEGAWSPGWYTRGTFKDNIFNGKINTEKQGGNATGTIKIEVDDNKNILSLNVMAYHSDALGYSSQWGFNASGIPHTENEPYLLVYSYSGTAVCSYVKSVTGKYTNPDGSSSEVRLKGCEEESLLHIKFHNWD